MKIITMVREKVRVSTRTLQWKCVELRVDSKCLYYGRFILSPLMKGQVDAIGIAMRRVLLGEIEGTYITRAKSESIPHEYSTIAGIQELVHEILMNLKEIVLKSNLYGTQEASIYFQGPGYVTTQDIILPPSVELIDSTQHIANVTELINLCIGLEIDRNRGYRIKTLKNFQDGSYTIDVVFMPVDGFQKLRTIEPFYCSVRLIFCVKNSFSARFGSRSDSVINWAEVIHIIGISVVLEQF